jgi:hypothetical protein
MKLIKKMELSSKNIRIFKSVWQLQAILFPEEAGLVEIQDKTQDNAVKGELSQPFFQWFGGWMSKDRCNLQTDELHPELVMYVPTSELWFSDVPNAFKNIKDKATRLNFIRDDVILKFIGILYVEERKDRKGVYMYLDFICATKGYGKMVMSRLFNRFPYINRWKLNAIPSAKAYWEKVGFQFFGVFDKFENEEGTLVLPGRVPSMVRTNKCITCKKEQVNWIDKLTDNEFCSEKCFFVLEKYHSKTTSGARSFFELR